MFEYINRARLNSKLLGAILQLVDLSPNLEISRLGGPLGRMKKGNHDSLCSIPCIHSLEPREDL
jgi:hypothetical protein